MQTEGYFFQVTAFLAATATSALNRLLATMSQQPCLPVPLRRKREDGSTIDFSDIESMDAMEYVAAVVQQANALPDVFVAEAASKHCGRAAPTSPRTD